MSDYLFDGEGPVDLEVARLEHLLRPYRQPPPRKGRVGMSMLARATALAAAAVLLVAVAWWQTRGPQPWSARTASCAGCAWEEGTWLDTSEPAEAQLADRGTLAAKPGTRVRLLKREGRAVLGLDEGTLDVAVDAPARWLTVRLPGADLVDLGCAYTVRVDEEGHGLVHVRSGWVALEGATESQVPAGAAAATWPSGHTGLPVVQGARAPLIEAVDRFDRGDGSVAQAILDASGRPEDALTLWHLLQRVPSEQRAPVVARMRALVPGELPGTDAGLVALQPEDLSGTLAYLVGATL